MSRNYGKFLAIFCIGLYCNTAIATENTTLLTAKNKLISFLTSSFVATLSVGPAWESAGRNQTLNLAPEIEKTYTANQPNNTIANYDLFLGIQKPLTEKLQGQVGLDFAATSKARLSGDIWDDADPTFDNYTYRYNIRHTQIALKGKLLGNLSWPVQPWISATMGVGFNQSNNFTNTPLIYEAIQSPNFSSKTVTAFTYAAGIGIERTLNKHWQMGIGYEFADWGKSALGSLEGSTTNQSPSLSHLYTNSLLLNVTFLA